MRICRGEAQLTKRRDGYFATFNVPRGAGSFKFGELTVTSKSMGELRMIYRWWVKTKVGCRLFSSLLKIRLARMERQRPS